MKTEPKKSLSQPKIFEKRSICDKTKNKKLIIVKNQSNFESTFEKMKNFFAGSKNRKNAFRRSFKDQQAQNISENTQTENKNNSETDFDKTAYISKSFFSTKRNGSQVSSIDSLTSNVCEIIQEKPINKKILTSQQAFKKKFIQNLGEDYSPRLLTTKACNFF